MKKAYFLNFSFGYDESRKKNNTQKLKYQIMLNEVSELCLHPWCECEDIKCTKYHTQKLSYAMMFNECLCELCLHL